MFRLLLSFPLALVICYGLMAVMAWMVDFNSKPLRTQQEPLQLNILVAEPAQASERISRLLPAPPVQTLQPARPDSEPPRTQTSMAKPALEQLPDLKLALAVSEMNISVPALKGRREVTSATLAVAASELLDEGQQFQSQQVMPLHRIEPIYPRKAVQRKIEGYVILSFDIDRSGRPKRVEIVEANPARIFDREALKALKRWRYRPFILNGEAQERLGQRVKLEFRLR